MYNPTNPTNSATEREAQLKSRKTALERMRLLRMQAISQGLQLLSVDEINHLVADRRGKNED